MNQHLQTILDFIELSTHLSVEEKTVLIKAVKKADSDLIISEFKLERTERVKRTTGILLEETIEELEQKRKAVEAQNRELEIETALEKVRSRTMAMQHSDELTETSYLLDSQVRALGIKTWGCAFNIYGDKESTEWFGNEAGVLPTYTLPRKGIFKEYYQRGQKGESLLIREFSGQKCVDHYEFMSSLPVIGDVLKNLKKTNNGFPTYQIDHVVYFRYGYLLFITRVAVPQAHEIFKRFSKVFEQAYTRFLDLQKAEAQARGAIKQASLDRVRGEIASMRSTEDLNRITPIIWQELTNLGVPFFRCGVFIMNEENKNLQVYLSDPNGKSLGLMNLDFTTSELTKNSVAAWRKNSVFKAHWSKEEFIEWTKSLMDLGKIKSKEGYQGGDSAPASLDLHFVPFSQGMLYVGSLNPLTEEQIELVKNLSESFSIAYARYEDFVKLEKAKEIVETTLTELKATQSQLIQSEKMASLGELTAGIAHEIQNPLNFVNNFSEVSNELIDEMNEEIEKGDFEEAKAISIDIKQNLEKINHHGKRADGIVKGMLQHSRSSTGQKELTDINKLADEYLRLAYHGLRAKDQSFNATLETDFDKAVEFVSIVPQDIGRVILNLLTNAFHAVKEKASSAKVSKDIDYKPTVSVSTKSEDKAIRISVADNGNGIPESVKNKIFQPFFTTKPTGQGTGLGLSMSYEIITKGHGGQLKVKTKKGEGTTFTAIIPEK